jgi:hypothetical protein
MTVDQNKIIEVNKSALGFHTSNLDRVQKLCDPLKYLGITTFCYLRLFEGSTYLRICNHDAWAKYSLQNIHDSGKAFSKIATLTGSEVTSFIWPDETTDHLLIQLKNHNICHGISFYRRTGNSIENWNFSSQPGNSQVYELYTKHKALLWKFIQYFCEQAADLMDHSDPRRLAIYKDGNPIASATTSLAEDNISKFLQGIQTKQYIMRYNKSLAFISERERQCLELIAKGFTQSDQMGLPSHIVERYLDQVKLKLGAACKNELLDALEYNHFD